MIHQKNKWKHQSQLNELQTSGSQQRVSRLNVWDNPRKDPDRFAAVHILLHLGLY